MSDNSMNEMALRMFAIQTAVGLLEFEGIQFEKEDVVPFAGEIMSFLKEEDKQEFSPEVVQLN